MSKIKNQPKFSPIERFAEINTNLSNLIFEIDKKINYSILKYAIINLSEATDAIVQCFAAQVHIKIQEKGDVEYASNEWQVLI